MEVGRRMRMAAKQVTDSADVISFKSINRNNGTFLKTILYTTLMEASPPSAEKGHTLLY